MSCETFASQLVFYYFLKLCYNQSFFFHDVYDFFHVFCAEFVGGCLDHDTDHRFSTAFSYENSAVISKNFRHMFDGFYDFRIFSGYARSEEAADKS